MESAQLEQAIAVAAAAHAGQLDKQGLPYIEHPLAVMRLVASVNAGVDAQVAAVLHDVVEDTAVTLDDLQRFGFSAAVIDAVDALTKRPGEARDLFIRRAHRNPIARVVKRADIAHNSDAERLDPLPEVDRNRLRSKYRRDLVLLERLDRFEADRSSVGL